MILLFICLLIFNVFFNYKDLVLCIYDSLFIWFYNIYPSVFIFYNISYYLKYNNLFKKCSLILSLIIKLDSPKAYNILLINILLGNPGTSVLINESYLNNEISEYDYIILNDICFFMNPLFILNFINIKCYLIYLLSSFIFIKLYSLFIFKKNNFDNQYNILVKEKYTFNTFSKSLNDVIYILLNIACLVTFFNIFKNTLSYFLNFFNIKINFLLSFLEVTSGLKSFSIYKNIYIFILLISFQGICILVQSYNVINKKNISLIRYILRHLFSAIIVTLIFYILTILFHI